MGNEDNVNIHFVLPPGKNETTCSEDLAYAYDQTQDAGLHPQWIQHDEVLERGFSKVDVFVMDPFEGRAFEAVSLSKATIVGPRCLLSCLQKKEPVPELPYPMFTAAMKGLVITSTGFEKEKKLQIQKLVEQMSGIYSNAFHDGVTHLVAAVVRSSKYSVAVEKEIPIMTEEWVRQVWSRSQSEHVAAVDRLFARYACPALMGLSISVSQMSVKDKELLKKSIESHGGTYSKSLDMHSTNILIIPTPEGEKFIYARKWKIPTLNANWVFDSILKGHCLDIQEYRVEKRTCVSTPNKEEEPSRSLAEVSLCSTIMAPNQSAICSRVNETLLDNNSLLSSNSLSGAKGRKSVDAWLQCLDMSRVSKAGPFLEGCRVFLSGFDESQQEHLRRVLMSAGASRMTQLTPSVSHMVVKSFAKSKLLRELNLNPHQVTVGWVVESMALGRAAPEADFPPPKIQSSLPPPGVSEKATQGDEDDSSILAQYSKKQAAHPPPAPLVPPDSGGNDEEDYSQLTKFLTGKKLALVGLDEETESELNEWIDEEGGEILSDKGVLLDYLVLPVHGVPRHGYRAKCTVNHLWLAECFDKGGFVNIQYFFKSYPIDVNVKPLKGVVIGISGFASQERSFLCSLTEALGGLSQETFAKREKGDTKKSSHLVCLSPDGNKYDAAIRWKLPVVSKDWLMSCLSKMKWISEKPFLLGDSDVYSPERPLPDDVRDAVVQPDSPMHEEPPHPTDKLKRQKDFYSPSIGSKHHHISVNSSSSITSSQKRKRMPSEDTDTRADVSFSTFLNKDEGESPRHLLKHRDKSSSQTSVSDSQAALDTLAARGIPVLERAGRSFDDLMEDKMNPLEGRSCGKRAKLIRDDGPPFEGIKIYVAKKCLSHIERLRRAVTLLGGSLLSSYDEENVTHVVFSSSRTNDTTKEYRQARGDGKIIVGPDWVFECEKRGAALQPGKFPHTLNAEKYSAAPVPKKPLVDSNNKSRDLSQDIAKMNEIIKSGDGSSDVKRKSGGPIKRIKMTLSSTECNPGRSSLENSKDSSDFDSQALGSQIQWIDPKESKEQVKLAKKLSVRDSETTINNMEFQSMDVLEPESSTDKKKNKQKYRFMISGYPEEVKANFGNLISSLGDPQFSFSNVNGCDSEATHVIAPKFPRSEKMLCAIASGKMFLHSSYFEDVMAAQEIITPLEGYEWGHPANPFLSKMEEGGFEKQLALASHRWRMKLWKGGAGKGAFDGIVAIIHTTPKRREAFQRLIEFGGGLVRSLNPPYSEGAEDVTHVFAEPSKVPKSRIDYESLAAKGIAVVEPLFINEFLIREPSPPVEEYFVKDFRPIWERHQGGG